ncbi:C2 NT-type domain-containing protein [Citrus sinensis]|uniref:C2 NT-type domain-containing protein n=1 Tax=Citrus sinensis TaxID=2711 RepID=A0ACB8N3V7_CITSI|nr:C2 NT-type domain-containing protein [Citrus sinensis]
MVLGLSAKNRKEASIHVDYQIHIQDIKPWPPSQSLRSLRSVMIQWQNGDRNSGSTKTVGPSLGSVIGEGKIEFNESFRLRVTLLRDMNVKNKDADTFLKNCLEFNLYEPRRDKTQLLATATIDLADYGIVKETLSVNAPMNSKRSFRNTAQPVLFIKIQPAEKSVSRTSSSLREGFSREASLDKNGGESVSALMNEEYAEEAESASFTDDDVSSRSSPTVSSTVEMNNGFPQNEEIRSVTLSDSAEGFKKEQALASKSHPDKSNIKAQISPHEHLKGASLNDKHPLIQEIGSSNSSDSQVNGENDANGKTWRMGKVSMEEGAYLDDYCNDFVKYRMEQEDNELEREIFEKGRHSAGDEPLNFCSRNATRNQVSLGSDSPSPIREDPVNFGTKRNLLKSDRLKNVRSVRSSSDIARSNGNQKEVKENGVLGDAPNRAGSFGSPERKDYKVYPRDTRSAVAESKIQQLEHKINMLETELREAAAIEASLYSVVAEHGSSMSKVHAPARRLSRLYLHACKEDFQSRRASAARSAVSGLVLVAKACGNDVPRLTFWLSNSIVLRAIISQATGRLEQPFAAGQSLERNSSQRGNNNITSPLKWKESASRKKDNRNVMRGSFDDWEDPHTLPSALEKVEAWIFSRIVESIWWQTLTPHMQSAAERVMDRDIGSCSRKNLERTSSSGDQEQINFSLDHWKKAFKDACERLCPVRAGGHECGCLPLLARLIMEQCVARLDVAMFNAILRESADEIPTDPVSDPISDSKVLPIPAGKSSFGAGAQLKNAIGNWSRWLSDLFGMDDDDSLDNENEHDADDERQDSSFKSFHLLNALSDLMMLPKDLLLSRSIRKEVCPTFGAPLIKRVLDNFCPDEFCPDPIPRVVLEALDSEDLEAGEESITNFPCIAAPPLYTPPSADSAASSIGDFGSNSQLRRSGSSVVRKSYTSDDELDELNSPLASIFISSSRSSPVPTRPSRISKGNNNQSAVRYELLRDIWMNSEYI